jgi:hypothetical protein
LVVTSHVHVLLISTVASGLYEVWMLNMTDNKCECVNSIAHPHACLNRSKTLQFVSLPCLPSSVCTVAFAFDCIVLTGLTRAISSEGESARITDTTLTRGLVVVVPFLVVEQVVASMPIAPKHRPSSSNQHHDTAMLGLQLYLVGIGIQEVIAAYTFALAVILHRRLTTTEVKGQHTTVIDLPNHALTRWRSLSCTLLLSLGAIFTRIAYRLVELSGLFTGFLLGLAHYEVFFYTFECLPVLAALGVWAIVDTEGLLDHGPSIGTLTGPYSYHEVSEILLDDQLPALLRAGAELKCFR